MFPHRPEFQVSHENVYKVIYAHPHGELRKELITCLRQGHINCRPRAGGVDRRQQIPDLVSIHLRPPEVDERLLPGHWEGDLIRDAFNRSAVGTLVERVSGLVFLAKMDGATAAVQGFSVALNRVPLEMRQTFTYDQGRELVRHAEIAQKTGTAIYFADLHNPWQRAVNENTNGLLRQYMPKGTDLSVFSQDEMDALAFQLNLDDEVELLLLSLGASPALLDHCLTLGRRGVVLAAFGRGNAPQGFAASVQRLNAAGVPVVIASRCAEGRTLPVYGKDSGGCSLEDAGGIFSGNFQPLKARLLLSVLLASGADVSSIRSVFATQG